MTETTDSIFKFIVVDRLWLIPVVLFFAWLTIRLSTRYLEALGARFTKHRLLAKQAAAVGRFAVLLLSLLILGSSVIQLSDEALLAVGGSVAVAVGFGFKDLLASLMAGLILLFDRPFQVGDRVEFAGHYGEVVEIGLRTVRLVTLDDNLVSIPNNQFLTSAVACANAGALDQMCVFDFFLGCNEDFDAAKRIVYEAAAASPYVYLGKPITVLVREGPVPGAPERFALRLTVKAYVLDGRFETAFGTDVTERVKRALRQRGIRTAGELEWLRRQAQAG